MRLIHGRLRYLSQGKAWIQVFFKPCRVDSTSSVPPFTWSKSLWCVSIFPLGKKKNTKSCWKFGEKKMTSLQGHAINFIRNYLKTTHVQDFLICQVAVRSTVSLVAEDRLQHLWNTIKNEILQMPYAFDKIHDQWCHPTNTHPLYTPSSSSHPTPASSNTKLMCSKKGQN